MSSKQIIFPWNVAPSKTEKKGMHVHKIPNESVLFPLA